MNEDLTAQQTTRRCDICGAPDDAPRLTPRGKLDDWGKFCPGFAAWLAAQGWPERIRRPSEIRPHEVGRPADVKCAHEHASCAIAYAADIDGRLGEAPSQTALAVRVELFRFVEVAISTKCEENDRWFPTARFRAQAAYELAQLRTRLPGLASFEGDDWDTLHNAATILVEGKQAWPLIRALVQLLRASPKPTVANDLKYWHDRHVTSWSRHFTEAPLEAESLARDAEDEEERRARCAESGQFTFDSAGITSSVPPDGWHKIPYELGYSIQYVLSSAESADPALLKLRTEFARYLLDRLKPGDKFESHPKWRLGYCRAIEALRVNPNGRGHRVLYHVMREDGDREVSAQAAGAYKALRGNPSVRGSPRRACLDAVWELLRAHLQALKCSIDEPAAERVRREMIRRTTRPEEE